MSLMDGDRKVTFYFMTANDGPTFQIRGPAKVEFYIKAKLNTGASKPTGSLLVSVDGGRPKTFKLDFAAELKAAKAAGKGQFVATASGPVRVNVAGGSHMYELRFDGNLTGFARAQEESMGELPDIMALAGPEPELPGLPDLPAAGKKQPAGGLDIPDLPLDAPPPKKAAVAGGLDIPDLPLDAPPPKKAPPAGGLDIPDLPLDAPPPKKAPPPADALALDIPDLPPAGPAGKKQPDKGKKAPADPMALEIPDLPPAKKQPPKEKVIVAAIPKEPPKAAPQPPIAPEPALPPGPPTPSSVIISPEVAMASSLETATGDTNAEFAVGAGVTWAYGSLRVGAKGGVHTYTRGYYEPGLAAFTLVGPTSVATSEKRYDGAASIGWRLIGSNPGAGMTLDAAAGFRVSVFDSIFASKMMGPTVAGTVGLPLAPTLELSLGVSYAYNIAAASGSESVLGNPKGATGYHAAIVMKFPPTARVRLGYSGEAMAQEYSNRLTNGMGLALEFEL